MGDVLRELRIVLVALAVLAVPAFLLYKGYDSSPDKTGSGASDSPGSVRAATPADSDPTKIEPEQSLYRRENMAAAIRALRRKAGSRALLLKVTVLPYAVEWHLRKGERATGYQWFAKRKQLEPIQVNVIGTGSLDDEDFTLRRVSADVVAKLDARVRDEDAQYSTTNLVLERVPPDAYLRWSINAEAEGRSGLVWNADPDGRGFADPSEFARRRLGG
jgi:hypothetical protein